MYALRSLKGCMVLFFGITAVTRPSNFQVFQGLYFSLIPNHAFDFWLAEESFEPSWKSGQAKTRPARPVFHP